jgi:DNA segregation ATPase FtsK/SpoIIIE, S-DNA-T family
MGQRPRFRRSPRLIPEVPRGEIEIPAPPPAPAKPSVSLAMLLLPVAITVLSLGAGLFYSLRRGGGPSMLLFSLPMMVGSAILPISNFLAQKKGFERASADREQRFRSLLQSRRQELERRRQEQQTALAQTSPDPGECLARVAALDSRMWERSPDHADWLSLRLGTGRAPLSVAVRLPRRDLALEPDPLLQAAQQLAAEFHEVFDVPVSLPLRGVGVAGMAGPSAEVLNAVRTLAVQLATHHSPDEVKLVAVCSREQAADWAWLRWLPHLYAGDRTRLILSEGEEGQRVLSDLFDLLSRRRHALTESRAGEQQAPLPHFIFLVGAPWLLEQHGLLPLLLRDGPACGAFPVMLAGRREELPKECRAIAEVGPGTGLLTQLAPERAQIAFRPDNVTPELGEELARSLAPLRLQEPAEAAPLPGSLFFLAMMGARRAEELAAPARWQSTEPFRSLAAPLGFRAGGEPVLIDLHERGHGPHGLVAGATGSGKSELLQSLIASLACFYHPHDLVFVLVDYKGGGMANAFAGLPHLVGAITNLQGNLAARALAAIKGELRRRQSLLADAGVNHIDEYMQLRRQGEALVPLPHLVIIVDEFAELKKEMPDFMRELISAVRVGRSLGVHLILATQKPAGVVDEQIWSNSRFRLCLRVERPEDSQEVLKRPDASDLTRPGRAYFQVGNNERFELLQAAWGGAPYLPDDPGRDPREIVLVALDGSRRTLTPPSKPPARARLTQLQAVVAYLEREAAAAGAARLPGPWLSPLEPEIPLPAFRPDEGWDGTGWRPSPVWLAPAVGIVDDPERQFQGPLRLQLGKEGHLAVYGAPGMGKSTFLQTLITSLALTYSPLDLHLYLLDFGGRSLASFARLPHVGAVILEDDEERLHRLLRFLRDELDGRKEQFAQAGVTTLNAYRAAGHLLPAIVVALDNWTGFVGAYPDLEEQVAQVAREGGNLGIHLVLTANGPNAVRSKVSSNFMAAVALTLAERDYAPAVGRTGGLEPAPFPGRGLVRAAPPLEFQTALPAAGASEAERTAALKALVLRMEGAWSGPRVREIRVLPEVVPLCTLLMPGSEWPEYQAETPLAAPIGLDTETLEPVAADLAAGQHFLLAGPPQSGKTTLLAAWLLALAERYPPDLVRFILADFRGDGLTPLQGLPHVMACTADDSRLAELADEVSEQLLVQRQAIAPGQAVLPLTLLAIDDYDSFRDAAQEATKRAWEQLVRRERGPGFHVLLAGSPSSLSTGYDGFVRAVRALQTGALFSADHSDLSLFGLRLPIGESGKPMAPGEAFWARRGRYRRLKAATAQAGALTVKEWTERILMRGAGVR